MDQTATARGFTNSVDRTAFLLGCGSVAGFLFIAVSFALAFSRSGYEFSEHPLSLLSLGDFGWVQILNFVVVGGLFLACAFGMRDALGQENGGIWIPRLLGVFGACVVAGGILLTDPAFGFPAGAPVGQAKEMSWHGVGHAIAFPLGFVALVASFFVFARRYRRARERGWAAACVAIGVVVFVLSMWPNLADSPEGRFAPLWAAMVLAFGWVSIMAIRLQRNPSGIRPGDERSLRRG